jgi:hypothetical protein
MVNHIGYKQHLVNVMYASNRITPIIAITNPYSSSAVRNTVLVDIFHLVSRRGSARRAKSCGVEAMLLLVHVIILIGGRILVRILQLVEDLQAFVERVLLSNELPASLLTLGRLSEEHLRIARSYVVVSEMY